MRGVSKPHPREDQMLTLVAGHLRQNLVAYVALFFGLAGTSFGAAKMIVPANSVGTRQLTKNAVTARKIHANAVTAKKIRANAVTSIKVKNNSLTGRDIAESKLGRVPAAAFANSASVARSATVAGTAVNAVNASFLNGINASGFVRTAQPVSGDLTGFYPNPSISNGAVTPAKLSPAEAWHDVTFTAPARWANFGAPHNPVSFMKDQLGFVHLRGVAKNIAGSALAGGCGPLDPGVLFQLPPGYKPANEERFPDVNTDAFGYVDVTQTGIACSGASTADGGYLTLDGITFRAAS
jgi:hypothetical protein